MTIQAAESPEFDNVFVALGSFHIELAFFSVLGKIVQASQVATIFENLRLRGSEMELLIKKNV